MNPMEAKKIDQFTDEQIRNAQSIVSAYNSATKSCTRYKQPENVGMVAACVEDDDDVQQEITPCKRPDLKVVH